MADCQQSSPILVDILRVLQRIEGKLERQDRRFGHLEDVETVRADTQTKRSNNGRLEEHSKNYENMADADKKLGCSHGNPKFNHEILNQSLFQAVPDRDDTLVNKHEAFKIAYSNWSYNERYQGLEEAFTVMLGKYLGDYWRIPADNRLPLILFHGSIQSTRDYWESQMANVYTERNRAIGTELDYLQQFDTNHRSQDGNDFLVVDFDLGNNTRIYRVGEEVIGKELMVEREADQAPWSRLVLYQGMTTGRSFNPQEGSQIHNKILLGPKPYFRTGDGSSGLWTHIDSHLQLKRKKITMNPYQVDSGAGFHTTFYEIRKSEYLQLKESWKHGPLYDHPLGFFFRKSAYTLYVPDSLTIDGVNKTHDDYHSSLSRHWCITLMAPDHFFTVNNNSFPMAHLDSGRAQALGHCLGKLTRQGAEMNLIGQGLERISERWAEFQSFFEFILDGGDALMNPDEHDRLLFDDGAFSRSRRYFWAIDCLSEFELSISDNIIQWELYKTARVLPLLSAKSLAELDFLQFKNAERQYNILLNQREFFRQKLAATKALRDALFSASAVIESRASTRLGENVKLLTYVNIFFLPLAFCTSLWSINDKFSSSALVAVIIIVALATYITMFNINHLVNLSSRLYDIKKRRVVQEMKHDDETVWRQRGNKFETFRPKHENPAPSEWYIPVYAMLNPLVMLGLRRNGKAQTKEGQTELKKSGRFGIPTWLRKRPKSKQEETRDEAWVF